MSDPTAATETDDTAPSGWAAFADDLLGLAHAAIDHGLAHGEPPRVDLARLDPALHAERATFVTLLDGQGGLRGCIGSIEAHRPIALDVSANAFAAAFQDPRFPPLTAAERPDLQCKLSVLTPLEPIAFSDEADLINQLVPGEDGVLIEAGERRGTLLPQVWSDLPDPQAFWRTLKRKAGLGVEEWPANLRAYRYRAESIG